MKKILMAPRKNIVYTNDIFFDNESYFDYISNNNAIPVLAPIVTKETAKELAEMMDGLLLPGGEDVNPALYHQENTFSVPMVKDIEQNDILLYNAFKEAHKPIMGICRGLQIMNVIEGGTLIQDIHEADPNALEHTQTKINLPKYQICHRINTVEGTQLSSIIGSSTGVNSFHHQAIDKPAPFFTVSAYSSDGFVEAIEADKMIAVQWHPERLRDENSKKIIQYFLSM